MEKKKEEVVFKEHLGLNKYLEHFKMLKNVNTKCNSIAFILNSKNRMFHMFKEEKIKGYI